MQKYELNYPTIDLNNLYVDFKNKINELKNFTNWLNKEQFNSDL